MRDNIWNLVNKTFHLIEKSSDNPSTKNIDQLAENLCQKSKTNFIIYVYHRTQNCLNILKLLYLLNLFISSNFSKNLLRLFMNNTKINLKFLKNRSTLLINIRSNLNLLTDFLGYSKMKLYKRWSKFSLYILNCLLEI